MAQPIQPMHITRHDTDNDKLDIIIAKLDALSGPINEFAELVSALKAHPMLAPFLIPQKGTKNVQ